MGGGARPRRRTGLAMRPFGAAVVNVGVDGMWPSALLREPLPWAEAVRAEDSGSRGARGWHVLMSEVAMTKSGQVVGCGLRRAL
jgi:hypothetical protein